MRITLFQVYQYGPSSYLVRTGNGSNDDDVYEVDTDPASDGLFMYAGDWCNWKDELKIPLAWIPAILVNKTLDRCAIGDCSNDEDDEPCAGDGYDDAG